METVIKGLVIKSPHIDIILAGRKTWEIRGSNTRTRGWIALIKSGSLTVIGFCCLVDSLGPLSLEDMLANVDKHLIPAASLRAKMPYRRTHAWVLFNPYKLETPIPYHHPPGAVIWVNLPATQALKSALRLVQA